VAVLQYATRRTWLSRALLLAVPLLVLAVSQSYERQSLVDRAYPQPSASSNPPYTAALAASPEHAVYSNFSNNADYINVPIRFTGVPDGYAVTNDDFKFTLTAADGYQWTSPWQGYSDRPIRGNRRTQIGLRLTPALFRRFQSAPVTLQITFALTRLQAESTTTVPFPSDETAIDGLGICSPASERWTSLACRTAIWRPRFTYLTASWSDVPCSDTAPKPEDIAQGTAWQGSLDPRNPADLNLALFSVQSSTVYFSNQKMDNRPEPDFIRWHICPGTPLTLTQYHVVERTQTSITIPNFQIPATMRW
jgi:hypothetical protein